MKGTTRVWGALPGVWGMLGAWGALLELEDTGETGRGLGGTAGAG